MFLIKKWGILIKKESESLDFTGLEIPRDYEPIREDADNYEQRKARLSFYERNGFYITNYAMDDRGVDYETMCNELPFDPKEFEDATAILSFGLSSVKLYKR